MANDNKPHLDEAQDLRQIQPASGRMTNDGVTLALERIEVLEERAKTSTQANLAAGLFIGELEKCIDELKSVLEEFQGKLTELKDAYKALALNHDERLQKLEAKGNG